MHAPHWPRPQPNFGPVRPRSLRRMYRSGVSAAATMSCAAPLTIRRVVMLGGMRLPGAIDLLLVAAWRRGCQRPASLRQAGLLEAELNRVSVGESSPEPFRGTEGKAR